MKGYLFLAFLLVSGMLCAQTYLSEEELNERFTYEVLNEWGITYPIYRVYVFKDEKGVHELVLTEHPLVDGASENDSLKAYCFNVDSDGSRYLEWKLTDFTVDDEQSIWFWTKYLILEDVDRDGVIDPIVIYGSSGMNGTGDGRIKLLMYTDGTKVGLRHQNGILDDERNTRIDAAFFELEPAFHDTIRAVINRMQEDENAIFPAGWEEALEQGKTYWSE